MLRLLQGGTGHGRLSPQWTVNRGARPGARGPLWGWKRGPWPGGRGPGVRGGTRDVGAGAPVRRLSLSAPPTLLLSGSRPAAAPEVRTGTRT